MRRLVLAIAVLVGGLAHGSSIYPPEVRAHLSLSYTPACTLCHETESGGFGTVTTPFGRSMMARGLVAQNLGSLDTALDALAAEHTDSDGDGVPDIDELKAQVEAGIVAGGSVTCQDPSSLTRAASAVRRSRCSRWCWPGCCSGFAGPDPARHPQRSAGKRCPRPALGPSGSRAA